MQYVATAAFSLEGNVKRELAALGAENPCCELGGVRFEGDWLQAFRANLWLRQADRVLLIVGEGRAESFEELFQLVRAMPWHRYLPKNASFPVSGKCARSTLMSVRDCQAITKKAIAEAMKAAYHVNWCPEDGPVYQVDVSIHENSVRLTLDTSGDALNRRGYRTWNGEAPLRETLAAALVDMSAWRPDGDWRLHDPCCGTGTLLIEAALMQADRAPGLRRAFAMEKWAHVPAETFRLARQEALDRYQPDRIRGISGSDADPQALALCKNSDTLYKTHVMQVLLQYALADSMYGDTYRALFGLKPVRGKILHNPAYESVDTVLALAKQCRAVVVLAHPSVYHSMELAQELIQAGRIDGVEIDHPRNTPEDKAQLTAWAQQYDLIITGGTDYHGMNSAHPRPVGTCTTAEDQILRIRALAQKRKQEL